MNHARLTAFVILVGGCEEPAPPTPSDSIIVPYQFIIEFELDQDDDVVDPIARARFYDITQAYDLLGNAGTIELTGGDTVFADDVELNIETRTTLGSTLRVDYSQTVPGDQGTYDFAMRRPDRERIEATIPEAHPMQVAPIGEIAWTEWLDLSWTPVLEGATIDIGIRPLDEDCLTVIGGDVGHVVANLDDTGSYRIFADAYHSASQDCTYELIFTRRYVTSVPGNWHVKGQDLPASDVWAIGRRTTRQTFVALQR